MKNDFDGSLSSDMPRNKLLNLKNSCLWKLPKLKYQEIKRKRKPEKCNLGNKRILEEEGRKNGKDEIFEIMAENSTKLMTDGKQQIQNAQRTLGLQNAKGKKKKRSTPRQIIFKL